MTDHNDAIDRALGRLQDVSIHPVTTSRLAIWKDILDDLEAEIRRDQCEMDLAMIHAQRDELNEVHARLAAVVAKAQAAVDFADDLEPLDILILARGERDEQK